MRKIHDEEAQELKNNYNHYLDKRKEIMKHTQFEIEKISGNIINEYFCQLKQKLN